MPPPDLFLTAFLPLLFANLLSAQPRTSFRCDSLNPSCNLTATQAQRALLTSYNDLLPTLHAIKAHSRVPISVGPLIRNGDNRGLIDIDVPLDLSLAPAVNVSVCGSTTAASTIRDAVVCTVTRGAVQPPRGNTDPAGIGFSTQRRELLAARLGNPRGRRVLVATQLHGNEAASTEAALHMLSQLTRRPSLKRRVLLKLDLLFIIRANPDGGEPTANNRPPIGVPYNDTAGFFRYNIDPLAGGGFIQPSEPGFFGVVGRGYDLNRYIYAALDNAIRPVEAQALVAVVHAFRPFLAFDAHGDQPKTVCELDPDCVEIDCLPVKISACKPPAPPVPSILANREFMVEGSVSADDASILLGERSSAVTQGEVFEQNRILSRAIAAEMIKGLNGKFRGRVTRFSQVSLGGAMFTTGFLSGAPLPLGGTGTTWEVSNFAPAGRPVVQAVNASEDGELKPVIGPETFLIEPCYLADNICVHRLMMRKALLLAAKFAQKEPRNTRGFCELPLALGVVFSTPASAGWTGEIVREEPALVPNAGQCELPAAISGVCPGDIVYA